MLTGFRRSGKLDSMLSVANQCVCVGWAVNHLSLDKTHEHSVLALQFHLQVHESKLVCGDLQCVVTEKHPGDAIVTLCRNL